MTNPIIVVLKITLVELAGYTYHLQGFYLRLWGQTFRPVPYHIISGTLSPYYIYRFLFHYLSVALCCLGSCHYSLKNTGKCISKILISLIFWGLEVGGWCPQIPQGLTSLSLVILPMGDRVENCQKNLVSSPHIFRCACLAFCPAQRSWDEPC